MTVQTRTFAPEYLSFYVAGSRNVEIPLDHDRRGIVATRDCINVGCLYWNDGDTNVTIGLSENISLPNLPTFDKILNTPDRIVILFDANMPEIMKAEVESTETRVRIWTNHPTEPDEIVIALG